jgi:hypothetical protein
MEPIYTKPGIYMPWDQQEILERKSVLSSSPGEGVARKLSTIEERHQHHSYLFRR